MIHHILFESTPLLDEQLLRNQIEGTSQRAQHLQQSIPLSIVQPFPRIDPLTFFGQGQSIAQERFFWSHPGVYTLVGIGTTWHTVPSETARFATATQHWQALCEQTVLYSEQTIPATGPISISGFAFDHENQCSETWQDYPDGLLVLPRYMLTHIFGAYWLTINIIIHPDSDIDNEVRAIKEDLYRLFSTQVELENDYTDCPLLHLEDVLPAARWQHTVGRAVNSIQQGDMQKVVLARESRVTSDTPLSIEDTLQHLQDDYPNCYIFALDRGSSCFLGASPERLVRLHKGSISTMALAGSIARGTTADEDDRLGFQLLASTKDRAEHDFVIHNIHQALADICTDLTSPPSPTLMKTASVQHLYTPISGQINYNHTIFDLVERLHPTPAVGGQPRDHALNFIREHEDLDRGWYAGPIGWVDRHGDGEFAVAIRSALLRENSASLFAGCGIVADSDPEREYAESQLKLRPILNALNGKYT
ncbi:MAG: isochorismate synthase [Chloroflexota bacterium]